MESGGLSTEGQTGSRIDDVVGPRLNLIDPAAAVVLSAPRRATAEAGSRPVAAIQHRGPAELMALQQTLHSATSVSELFTLASDIARAECGFELAAILAVNAHELTADRLDRLKHQGSDALRRRVLANPARLIPGSREAEFLRAAEGGRARVDSAAGVSSLVDGYGILNLALGGIAPRGETLALLVLGREHGKVTASDQVLVQGFCQLVTYSLERLIQGQRLVELQTELRYMMSSCQALLTEAVQSPLTLPADHGAGPVFSRVVEPALASASDLTALLTRREQSIAKEIIAGKSNREIAIALHISPDTVKQYVSRIMRKVGASNRAEAAVRCIQLGKSAA